MSQLLRIGKIENRRIDIIYGFNHKENLLFLMILNLYMYYLFYLFLYFELLFNNNEISAYIHKNLKIINFHLFIIIFIKI